MTKQEFVTDLEYNVIEETKEAIQNAHDLTDEELEELEEMDEYNLDEFQERYPDADPMERQDIAEEMLYDLDDEETIKLWNEYCQDSNDPANRIENNNEYFFKTYFSDIMEAVRAICYGEYLLEDDYVYIDGLDNVCSFDFIGDNNCPISESDLVDWLID